MTFECEDCNGRGAWLQTAPDNWGVSHETCGACAGTGFQLFVDNKDGTWWVFDETTSSHVLTDHAGVALPPRDLR